MTSAPAFALEPTEPLRMARFSPCRTWRYQLIRRWRFGAPLLPVIMLNPSIASEIIDDPTNRRVMGFAKREEFGGTLVGNLYGLCSTDPDALRYAADPFGPGNVEALRDIATTAIASGVSILCAWGAGGTIRGGDAACLEIMRRAGARLLCLGKTKDGHPRHPLYLPRDQPLEAFP